MGLIESIICAVAYSAIGTYCLVMLVLAFARDD